MVNTMLAACLSLIFASSCALAAPIFIENFDRDCTQGSKDIPGFEFDLAGFIDMTCDNSRSLSSSFSAKILPIGAQVATLWKTINAFPIDGREITFSFWLKWQNTNNPYPYSMAATWQRTTTAPRPGGFNIPVAGPVMPYDITRDTTTLPINGWYKYSGKFTPTAAPNQMSQATFIFSINFAREVSQSGSTNVWMDDVLVDYTPAPVIVGDPQFVGLRGQSYQVHGIDGAVYNLVSSSTTQVNSRFVFLDHGKCPIFNGIPASNCWAHPGSYLGQIGIQQVVDGVTHKLDIVAGSSIQGFKLINIDGKDMSIGDTFSDSSLFSVKYESSHQVTVQTSDFIFTFENSDLFINQAVATTTPLSQLTCHGLFGQTHKRVMYSSTLKYIAGEVDDYLINENDVFGHEFIYNQFPVPS